MQNQIINNLQNILQRIETACICSNRSPDEVRLLLATKTVPANRIKQALVAGSTLIAENKVQELKEKYDDLKRNTPYQSFYRTLANQQNKRHPEVRCKLYTVT